MSKKTKIFKIDHKFNWSYCTISDIRKDLDILEKLGTTDIEIDYHDEYGSTCIDFTAKCIREETDKEVEDRILAEKERYEKNKAFDLEMIKTLQKKHGLIP
jgi:hypothetical protein